MFNRFVFRPEYNTVCPEYNSIGIRHEEISVNLCILKLLDMENLKFKQCISNSDKS